MPQRKVFNRYLTESEEKQLFTHVWQYRAEVYAYRDYHWMMLLRQTGMRINNLAMMTVADAKAILADPDNRIKLRDSDSKRGHGYMVKFNRKALTSLRALLKLHSQRDSEILGSDSLVMSRQQGGGLSIRAFQQRMQQWVISSGLPVQASPHWFRHTLAKRIMQRSTHQNPLQLVQNVLGHSSMQSTAFYTVPDREDIDAAFEVAS